MSEAKTNLSNRDGSFDTHIDIDYDKILHMVYVIKCHKMPNLAFYDICHMTKSGMNYVNMDIKRIVSTRQINHGLLTKNAKN